ncbi:MAG: hypothetical protein NPIRA04_33660 [Nitrospirales bacterium]|nr:MAG: hypothetical protein NPIRA02_22390 [Nitrospirales bacterium]GJL64712.1 MAG: hypothetical protein NPIRA04_33660 [Nitrospirales bacterium]
MNYWIHVKHALDQAMLHRERCLEIPSMTGRADFWEGGWFEYPNRETALEELENTGLSRLVHCPICKP